MAGRARDEEAGLGDLVKEALSDVEELVRIEIALAKQEVQHDALKMKNAGIAFVVAAAGALLGLSMLLMAVVLAVGGGYLTAVGLGVILLGLSIIAGAVGARLMPREPGPDHTRANIKKQAELLKERVA